METARMFTRPPWVSRHGEDSPRYAPSLFKEKFYAELKRAVTSNSDTSPPVRSRDFYMKIWEAAYNSTMNDKEMSANPIIQAYVGEDIRASKWWDWHGERLTAEQEKNLATQGGHAAIQSASNVKLVDIAFREASQTKPQQLSRRHHHLHPMCHNWPVGVNRLLEAPIDCT
jgi:hypothetical protein